MRGDEERAAVRSEARSKRLSVVSMDCMCKEQSEHREDFFLNGEERSNELKVLVFKYCDILLSLRSNPLTPFCLSLLSSPSANEPTLE